MPSSRHGPALATRAPSPGRSSSPRISHPGLPSPRWQSMATTCRKHPLPKSPGASAASSPELSSSRRATAIRLFGIAPSTPVTSWLPASTELLTDSGRRARRCVRDARRRSSDWLGCFRPSLRTMLPSGGTPPLASSGCSTSLPSRCRSTTCSAPMPLARSWGYGKAVEGCRLSGWPTGVPWPCRAPPPDIPGRPTTRFALSRCVWLLPSSSWVWHRVTGSASSRPTTARSSGWPTLPPFLPD